MPVTVEFQHPLELQLLLETVKRATFAGEVSEVVTAVKQDLERALVAIQQQEQMEQQPAPVGAAEEMPPGLELVDDPEAE